MDNKSILFQPGQVLGAVSSTNTTVKQSSLFQPGQVLGEVSAEEQLKSQLNSKIVQPMELVKNPTSANKKLADAVNLKTTIPSASYDEGVVKELKLKNEMDVAEKEYKNAQDTFNINPVMKQLESLGVNHKNVGPYETAYENKKKEYKTYEKARYYAAMPNGEVKTTNPENKRYFSLDSSIDWEYEYINDIGGIRNTIQAQSVRSGGGNAYELYDYMTEREVGIYNYIYAENGKKQAKEFLDFIEDDLETRLSTKNAKSAQKFADEHPYVAAALSIPANVFAAGEQVSNILEYTFTGDLNRNNMADTANVYRSYLPEKVNWEIGNWDAFDFVYNTTMSGIDSFVVAPAGTVGAVALGLSAAASTTNDILDRGGNNVQAFWGGIAAGTFEGFFEKFSLSQLDSMQEGMVKGFKDFAKNVGKSMLVNASEETATEIANILYDYVANGGISQYALLVKEYTDNGDDEKTAKKKAAQKLGLQILEAGASGALMGLGFASVGSASAYRNYKKDTSFAKQVDEVINGTHNPRYDLYVSETPKIFTDLGFTDSPLLMRNGKVNEILKKHSEMSVDTIKQIPQAIQNPILILKSKTNPTQSVVAITDVITEKGNMIVPVWINQEGNYIDVDFGIDVVTDTNFVASAYGRNVKSLLEYANENNGFLYQSQNIEKVRQLIARNGLQLPTPLKLSDSDINISQNDNDVNNIISTEPSNNSQNPDSGAGDVARVIGDRVSILRNNTDRRHTTLKEQQYIQKICDALGVEVVFEDMAEYMKANGFDTSSGIIEGYIDKSNVIHIGWTVRNPVQFVLKHELTHFLENNKAKYNDFANSIMDNELFKEWVKSKGYASTSEYNATIVQHYSQLDKKFGEHEANLEMVANFVGENLFGNENELKRLLESLNPNQRSKFVQFIHDFLAFLKEKLGGQAEVSAEIKVLENNFIKLLKEVSSEQKNTAENSGEYVYSFSAERQRESDTPRTLHAVVNERENPNANVELSNSRVAQKSPTVKNNSMQESENYSSNNDKFSFAPVDDKSLVAKAEDMESNNASRKEIWQKLGIIRDASGEWIYEISDDEMKFSPLGKVKYLESPEYKEYLELRKLKRRTKEKTKRFFDLGMKYGTGALPHGKLKDFLIHDKLFEKYPNLKETNFEFGMLGKGTFGNYNPDTNTITLNADFLEESTANDKSERDFEDFANELKMKQTLMHEVQHAMQEYDNRERGSNELYWQHRAMMGDIPLSSNSKPLTPRKAYENTAGEIEAKQTENRTFLNEESRRDKMPNLGWDKAVFTSKSYQLANKSSEAIDAEYSSAVEKGDTRAIQNMVDNAAMSSGYTERLYHQTNADFTEFNTENQKAGKYDTELPTGTFLKPSDEDIGLSGKKQMELYAQIKKPLQFKDRDDARQFWSENIDGYAEAIKVVSDIDSEYRQKYSEAEGDVRRYMINWRHSNPDASRQDIYSDTEFQRLLGRQQQVLEEWENKSNEASLEAKRLIDDFIAKNDYDGVIIENDQDGDNISTKSYIVFNSNQLKDAAPVTYDDAGNVIPLSARFDTEQGDIRYSFTEYTSAESLLEQYENGKITRQEYLDMIKKEKPLNPVEIANLKEEDANTTPTLKKRNGTNVGDKQSETYESLLGSSIFDERFKEEIADDTFIKNYQSITNKETLAKAAKELDEGGLSYVLKWNNTDPEHASLIDIAVGFILMDRYQRVGDYESAASVAEKVRMFGTSSGQQVQIFSILGRLDPNSMQAYAQQTLDKAFEKLADIKTKQWIDKNQSKFKLTEEDIEFIRRHTLQAALFDDNTRPKAIALGKICARIQDKIPPEAGQSIRALQRSNMLLNLKTILRNINGNAGMTPLFIASDFFGTLIDKGLSKKTEIRTTGIYGHPFTKNGRERLAKNMESFGKGVYESWDDFKRGIRTKQEDLNRFELNSSSGKNFNEHHTGKLAKQFDAISKFLNKMDNFTSFCLEVGDRPFFEMWMTNSLNNQLRLNKLEIPTPEMLEVAKQEALQRTWQDDSRFTRSASKIKSALNDMVHIPGTSYGLGDGVMKFIKTPSNIARAIGSFSPAGFVSAGVNAKKLKNAIDKDKFTPQLQKEYVRSLSNAITGTLIYVLVAVGAGLGVVKLSGDDDDDKDASNYEKYIMGIPPYSIEFFGVNITYDWMQPFGSVLAIVADFMESQEENPDGDVANAILEAIKAGGKAFTKQSFLQSLYDVFSSEDIVEALTSVALAEPAAFVPQRWSQMASFLDEYSRTSYDNTNSFKSAINKVIAKIPGLRTTLPKRVNVLGEDVKNTQYLDAWEAFASPWNTYPKSSSEVIGEIYSLYKSTGENSVIPRTAPNYFTVKGTKVAFTPEEKAEFQRNIGKRSAEMLGQLFDSKEYTNLSDEEKVTVISKIYQFAYDKAKSERKYDYDTLSAMVGEKKNGDPILTKSVYGRLSEEDKEELAQEYFLSKTEMRYINNYDRLIQYYIKQAKE